MGALYLEDISKARQMKARSGMSGSFCPTESDCDVADRTDEVEEEFAEEEAGKGEECALTLIG